VVLTPEGKVLICTPPDPQTGEESKILDPLPFEPRAPPATKTG
jgi:hypothetical protein